MDCVAIGIQKAIHRAYDNATGLVIVAYALVAFVWVDDKIFVAHGNCTDRAFVFAQAAIDASVGNRQRHSYLRLLDSHARLRAFVRA